MDRTHKHIIADTFGTHCHVYDRDAGVQRTVAENLIDLLPDVIAPRVLEIGCGTGFLTHRLFNKYPDGAFDITDISPAMVDYCREKQPHENARYYVLDADNTPSIMHTYDIIVSSMALQWLDNPIQTLETLKNIAPVYYATLGKDHFKEWRACLDDLGFANGMRPRHNWPEIVQEDHIKEQCGDAMEFLKMLKNTGVATASMNHAPLSIKDMRKAMRAFDDTDRMITWHVVYGINK